MQGRHNHPYCYPASTIPILLQPSLPCPLPTLNRHDLHHYSQYRTGIETRRRPGGPSHICTEQFYLQKRDQVRSDKHCDVVYHPWYFWAQPCDATPQCQDAKPLWWKIFTPLCTQISRSSSPSSLLQQTLSPSLVSPITTQPPHISVTRRLLYWTVVRHIRASH